MAQLQAALRQLINADSQLQELTSRRVRPVYGAQDDARPFITIQISANQGTMTHSGAAGSRNAVAEITIVSDTYADAEAIALRIDQILNGYRGTVGNVRISPAQLDDETDIDQSTPPGQSRPAYVKTLSYRCRYIVAA